jgi:hypothetical protein
MSITVRWRATAEFGISDDRLCSTIKFGDVLGVDLAGELHLEVGVILSKVLDRRVNDFAASGSNGLDEVLVTHVLAFGQRFGEVAST